MNKILPAILKFLDFSPVVLALVLPLLFIPATTEYFETAKVAFIYIFTSLTFIVWAIKMVYEKRVVFVRSPLDISMVGLGLVFSVITILSPNKYLAVAGSYLRFVPSLAFVLTLIVLYYSLSSNLKSRSMQRLAVLTYVFSVSIAATLALLAFFGVFTYLPTPGILGMLASSSFNTLGSLSGMASLAAAAFTLGLSAISQENIAKAGKSTGSYTTSGLGVSLFPLLGIVVVYGTLAGWVTLAVGLAFLTIFNPSVVKSVKANLASLAVWAILLLVIVLTPQAVKALRLNKPAEVSLPISESWQIASQTISNQPIFGAGIGQFSHMFTALKPLSFNNLTIWNLRFDRPFNEVLLIIAEAGILGVGAYLLLFAKIINLSFGLKNKEPLGAGLGAALLALIAVFFVTVGSSTLYVSLILLTAILVAMEENEGSKLAERVVVMLSTIRDRLLGVKGLTLAANDPSAAQSKTGVIGGMNQVLPYVMLVVAVLAGLAATAGAGLAYTAEFYNRRALAAVAKDDGRAAYENVVKAITYNPYIDVYQRNLSQIAMGVAVNLSARPTVNDTDKQTIQNLIQESIRRARIVSEIVDQLGVSNWETRAQVYQGLIGVATNAEQWTVDSYAKAISLDPGNPNLRVLLGGVYFSMGNYDLAANTFAQAVNLKPNVANAHYNLAQALFKLNQKANALSQYDVVLNLIGTSSPDYDRAKKERDALAKVIQNEADAPAPATVATQPTQEKLQVQTPTTNLLKKNVTPPEINLGNVKEASPASIGR